jgi:hypothetical protein
MPVLYEPDAPEDSFELTPDCNQLLVSGRYRIRITRTRVSTRRSACRSPSAGRVPHPSPPRWRPVARAAVT